MLSTVAKRGRSIKKCVRRMLKGSVLVVALRSGVADRAVLWRDFRPRSGVWDAVYDHLVIWRQAGPDDTQAAADVADLDLLGRDGGVRCDGHDEVPGLIRKHRGIRYQQGRSSGSDNQLHAGELARCQEEFWIWNCSAGMERAARTVEHIVHKIECALPSELGIVAQREFDLVGKNPLLPCTISGKRQEIGLAHIEIEVDRIERDERREQCRRTGRVTAAGNEVAHRDEMRADATGEGGRDAAMLEVELSVADLSLGIINGSLRGLQVGRALVDVLHRAEIGALQFLSAPKLALGEL